MNYKLAQTVGVCFFLLAFTQQHWGGEQNGSVAAVCIMPNETLAFIYQYFHMLKMLQDDEALHQKLHWTITCMKSVWSWNMFHSTFYWRLIIVTFCLNSRSHMLSPSHEHNPKTIQYALPSEIPFSASAWMEIAITIFPGPFLYAAARSAVQLSQ